MNQLTFEEVMRLHGKLIERFGGLDGLRDAEAVKSALQQPFVSWGGEDLYRTIEEKAAAVAFVLVKSHPFLDGNKRTAHAVMEIFLQLNGRSLEADPFETKDLFVDLAAGSATRDDLVAWIREHASRPGE